ncbi:cytochrome c family protein [Collimonas fungivorans]|uniref:Cytochrome c family protein n=1 Tax=Collimonas fungivorans TaxID=158899 RepID=A0A127PCJ2_9BURK|nr:cytochrome c peroxidase [Collimonas fungivorans]AMO95395.1 cytochrome c family protein [Collimonas fungivorans]
MNIFGKICGRCALVGLACVLSISVSIAYSQNSKIAIRPELNRLLGLPPLLSPPNTPAAVLAKNDQLANLGAKLFYDNRLSADGLHSCSSCHQPDKYFADGLDVSRGIGNQLGTRNAPSLLNVSYNPSQFWDGRDDTLEHQALRPFVNPREMGQPDHEAVLAVIRLDKDYRADFKRIFGAQLTADITIDTVVSALAAYQKTLVAGDSPFDRYAYAGDARAMSDGALRGYKLFVGAAACVKCHTIDTRNALFTDNEFHALSVGLNQIASRLPELTVKLSAEKLRGVPIDDIVLTDDDFAELGRFVVTLQPKDIGTFRTPTLRNVAMTAPYMHDGSVKTLAEAVDLEVFYRSNEQGHPLLLTPPERQDLITFLESLTSSPESLKALMPTEAQRKASKVAEQMLPPITGGKVYRQPG